MGEEGGGFVWYHASGDCPLEACQSATRNTGFGEAREGPHGSVRRFSENGYLVSPHAKRP